MSHPIALDAQTMEGFVDNFLLDRFEERRPIKQFHRDWWKDVTSNHRRVVLAAPRGHSKSTAINHAYGLAAALFQQHPFQLKVSKTYELACEKLQQAKEELIENDKIKAIFRLKRFIRERENDFIAEMSDGYQFRMYAVGMQQALRGVSWGTMRPTLIQGDDMEDDEEVLNKDRRDKAMRWVMRTLLPIGGDKTQFRIYGTVLHNDSILSRLLKNPTWKSSVYQACDGDISPESILWPEKFPINVLQDIRQGYVSEGDLQGFNMEYRNLATDLSSGFFRPEDFRSMDEDDYKKVENERLTYYVGGDFAISTKQHRDRTVFEVGGLDADGVLHVVDIRAGRWDAQQIIDEMFSIQETWHPEEWYIESGSILKALQSALEIAQREKNVYLPMTAMIPTKDKSARARAIQARMRARAVRFDNDASWYPEFENELLQFPRGEHDDYVDAHAWLGIGLARMVIPLTEEEEEDEEWERVKRAAKEAQADDRRLWTGLYGQH